MRLVIGLLAASVLGAEGPKTPDAPWISYQIKLLEMKGLDWRGSLHAQLQPVARQGTATVWTGPRDMAGRLTAKGGRVVAAPVVRASPRAQAIIDQSKTRNVVTSMRRQADGPVNHASFVGYMPQVESTREGWSAKVTGRKIDQGVLTQVFLEDKQITAVHSVALSEVLESKGAEDEETCVDTIRTSIQVPEIVRAEVSGEWLIPNDAVLVVSFGAHTVADADGKAVVRERLAVIEAHPAAEKTPSPARVTFTTPRGDVISPIFLPLPTPPLPPNRSLPQEVSANGATIQLPPLPEDVLTPTALPGSSEPCASPQTKTAQAGEPLPWKRSELRDAASTRAGFLPLLTSIMENDAPARSRGALARGKPFSFRLPWIGSVEIEVRASTTPALSAEVPAPPAVGGSKHD